MRFVKKLFLFRRRVDHWVLSAGSAALAIRNGVAGLSTFAFACIGFYLWVGRHKSVRPFCKPFHWFALCYFAWSCGLILLRSEHPLQDRQMSYSLFCALFAFAGAGMVLVADPLRSFVLGSRIGIAAAVLASVFVSLFGEDRLGMGGNPAVFAFTAAVAAIGAGIPLKDAPRWAPNGPFYLIAGCLVVLFTGTRAVLLALPPAALVETLLAGLALPRRARPAALAAAGCGLAVLAALPVTRDMVALRIVPAITHYAAPDEPGTPQSEELQKSTDIRLELWQGAARVIAGHPFAGVGSEAKMDAIAAEQTVADTRWSLRSFIHSHNAVLDELLNDGAVGLLILIGLFGSIARFVWVHSADAAQRRHLVYFFLAFFAYGMLHNPLLHEMTITAIFLYLGVMHAVAARQLRRAAAPVRLSPSGS